jgi:hypothetical protein
VAENQFGLLVTDEEKRPNRHISSHLFSRATIFHPSPTYTPWMLERMAGRLESDLNKPLSSVEFPLFSKNFRVDLHGDFLLQSHKDLLETIIAYAKTIKLDDESYAAGERLTWKAIFKALPELQVVGSGLEFDSVLDPDATVFSIGLYELAGWLSVKPDRVNYDLIEKRIFQLSMARLVVNEINEDGQIVDVNPIKFVDDFRLCYDSSKNKNGKGSRSTNHVFLVLDRRLIDAILNYGYYYRIEQHKIMHYRSPALRSFLKWIKTHEPQYLNGKKLAWTLAEYAKSVASPVGANFLRNLKEQVLSNVAEIEADFHFSIRKHSFDEEQIFYVGTGNNNGEGGLLNAKP